MTDIWKIRPVLVWDQERTCDIDFSRFSMFMTRYGMDKCFSSERASKMGLVVSWRQFPRNLEQNFDFPDFQGKQGTSCRKWRQTDMMVFVQFLRRSSCLELVCDTAKTYHLQPSRNDISSGGKKNDRMTVRVCFCRSESVFPLPKPCNVRIFQDGQNSRSNLFSLHRESNNV